MAYNIIVGRNEADKKALGDKGLIFIGKGYVKMGQYTSLSNKIFLDVAKSHVVLVSGKRGSGKSYTLGVIAEEISNLPKSVSQNIGSLIEDDLRLLRILHRLGLREGQLTYNEGNYIGDGCLERTQKGLTDFGLDVLSEMNRLGILADLSHTSDGVIADAIEHSKKPVAIKSISKNPTYLLKSRSRTPQIIPFPLPRVS